MSASSLSTSVFDRSTDNPAAVASTGRQSTEILPLITAEFIEDFLQTESDFDKRTGLKEAVASEKCLESLMVQSSTSTSSDKHNADQMFNYFFKKIENAEALNNNSEKRKENEFSQRMPLVQMSATEEERISNGMESRVRGICLMEEETMVSAVCSSESSCCSPGDTPNYAATPSRRSVDSFDSKTDDSEPSQSVLREWEPAGDPMLIEVVNQADESLNVRVSYSIMRHRVTSTIIRVGDAILLRDPNQQWFDRLPRVAEILKIYQDVPVESSLAPNPTCELHINLRRYYRSNQLLCVLPDIAVDMASPEAVVFSSSHVESYNPASEFFGTCILLSLNAFYRFWGEVTRLRHGRIKRRRYMSEDPPENWKDWLENPDRVFVICGEYDHVGKQVEVVDEPYLDLG